MNAGQHVIAIRGHDQFAARGRVGDGPGLEAKDGRHVREIILEAMHKLMEQKFVFAFGDSGALVRLGKLKESFVESTAYQRCEKPTQK
jgi:hypothetical protein